MENELLLGPAQVHAQEHGSPILRVGAAGSGVDGQQSVGSVVLAGKERLSLAPGNLGLQPLSFPVQFILQAFVAQFGQLESIRQALPEAEQGGRLLAEAGSLAHYHLGLFWI